MRPRILLVCGAALMLLSSCFVRKNLVHYKVEMPLTSTRNPDMNADSVRFVFQIEPATRNLVVPLFIFKKSKKKSRLLISAYGKGISAREYSIKYKELVIMVNDTTVIGKSADPELFEEITQHTIPANAITPLYGTRNLLKLHDPFGMKLKVHLEFEVKRKGGFKENFTINMPMQKIREKSFKLFNPLK